jgi:hypothetical protein
MLNLPIVQVVTRSVPCGTCNECCRRDAIFIHPECDDDPLTYETEPYRSRLILKHQTNGDCCYLDRTTGCTIHDRRPAVCRELDCRMLVGKLTNRNIVDLGIERIAYAARRLRKHGIGSSID